MMQVSVAELKSAIREALGAVKMLDSVDIRLSLIKGDVKIEEIITEIRIIKGVATVSQDIAVKRSAGGKRVLDLLISFDPKGLQLKDYLERLLGTIKQIHTVAHVVMLRLNGKTVHDAKGRRIVY